MGLRRAAATGVEVVHEQGRHERLGGGGLEDLDAEPRGTRVGGRQHAVLGDRTGAGRRGDVHRHGGPAVAGDRGPPALYPLGQGVVGSLLGHQAVADAGIGPGRIGRAEQPPAGQRPQRPGTQLRRPGPGRVGAGRVGDRGGRHGEHVGGRREERERDVASLGLQAHGQRVDGARDADVGRAVGVDVVAEHQRAVDVGQPVGRGRDVIGQVEARAPGEVLVIHLGREMPCPLAGDRDEQGPAAAPCRRQHPFPDVRAGQVDPDQPGSPVQQHRQRPHLGARPEYHDRAAGQRQPFGTRGDRADGVRA